MESIKLYRLLQQHVGKLNELVVMLYSGGIEAVKAEATAKAELEKTLAEINS
jgi:hypothetical protein